MNELFSSPDICVYHSKSPYNIGMEMTEKERLRNQLLAWRKTLSLTSVEQRSQRIIKDIVRLIPWREVESVHLYMPILENREVDTRLLLAHIWQERPDCSVSVPVIKKGEMVSVPITPTTAWRATALGIPEPVEGMPLSPDMRYDIIVVPTLGFTREGYRVGYGAGYYDKFLAGQPEALTAGLCYEEGQAIFIPETHDVPLKLIVTDKTVYWPSRMV